MYTIKFFIISLFLFFINISSSLAASSSTGNFQTTATLQSTCTIAADSVNFGVITISGTYQFGSGIRSTCSKDLAVTISFSTGSSGNYLSREMVGATSGNIDKLKYNIYTSAGFSSAAPNDNVLGDGTNGTNKISLVATGSQINVQAQIYLFTNQYVTPDIYTDNVTVTLSY